MGAAGRWWYKEYREYLRQERKASKFGLQADSVG